MQWRKDNDRETTFCQVEGCQRKSHFSRYCTPHRDRIKSGELDRPIRQYRYDGCSVSRCEEPHHSKGYCASHHWKYVAKGKTDSIDVALRYKYGITRAQRDGMFAAQHWACAICEDDRRQLLVDHDHNHCGGSRNGCPKCVRGGLCAKCNTMLFALENQQWRGRAENYLSSPPGIEFLIDSPSDI